MTFKDNLAMDGRDGNTPCQTGDLPIPVDTTLCDSRACAGLTGCSQPACREGRDASAGYGFVDMLAMVLAQVFTRER